MTKREKERLLAYIVNELIRRENDVYDRQRAFARYGDYEIYCYELALAIMRLHVFQEISTDILDILDLQIGKDTADKEAD